MIALGFAIVGLVTAVIALFYALCAYTIARTNFKMHGHNLKLWEAHNGAHETFQELVILLRKKYGADKVPAELEHAMRAYKAMACPCEDCSKARKSIEN